MPQTPINPWNMGGSAEGTLNQFGNLRGNQQNERDWYASTSFNPSGRHEANVFAKRMMPMVAWNDLYRQAMSNELLGGQMQAMRQWAQQLNNPDWQSQDFRRRMMGQAESQFPELMSHFAGKGIGSKEGAMLSLRNQANRAANENDQHIYSPQGMQERAGTFAQLMAMLRPDFNQLNTLHGIQLGTPRNQTGIGMLGGLASGLASGGAFGQGGIFR